MADEANPTPYKSYMGMGNALMKLGKSAEAGVAFREAARDEAPDISASWSTWVAWFCSEVPWATAPTARW